MVIVELHPAAAAAGPVPATFARRLAAQFLDWLVLFILACVLFAAAGLLLLLSSDMGRRDLDERAIYAALIITSLIVPVGFVVTLTGYTWHGRSAGKLAMSLRVTGPDGAPPGIARALVRLLIYLVEIAPLVGALPVAAFVLIVGPRDVPIQALAIGIALLLVPVISLVVMLRDHRRRALHDTVAGTSVVAE